MSLVSPIRKDMPAFLNIRPRIPLPGPQARRGSSGLFVLAGFFHGPLTFHITPHGLQRGTTNAAHIVSSMPKIRFPVKRFQVLGKAVPRPPGTGGFQVVDQRGNVESRMDFDQQMYMVRFTPELQECATPPFQDFREGFAQVI